jgi:glycosyltransferase involved in cell wall biosynthesis
MNRVLFSIGSLAPESGGPANMIVGLIRELSTLGHEIVIAAQNESPVGIVDLPESVTATEFPLGWPRAYAPNGTLRSYLAKESGGADVVHTFGLWRAVNRYARIGSAGCGKPFVISPQGMLALSALKRRKLAKMVIWAIWQKKALWSAECIHATSEQEAGDIRRLGLHQPAIAVVPNGVDVPKNLEQYRQTQLQTIAPDLEARRFFLYLGRIHPYKGVTELLAAWNRSRASEYGLGLVIAGPCEKKHESWFSRLLSSAPFSDSIKVVGEVRDGVKSSLLAQARALILPSLSENFGMVVAEALAHATPAIANVGAPWRLLEEEHCGWWIPKGEGALVAAIDEVTGMPEEIIEAMGRRGRRAVEDNLSWDAIGKMMSSVYGWLTGSANRPSWVIEG